MPAWQPAWQRSPPDLALPCNDVGIRGAVGVLRRCAAVHHPFGRHRCRQLPRRRHIVAARLLRWLLLLLLLQWLLLLLPLLVRPGILKRRLYRPCHVAVAVVGKLQGGHSRHSGRAEQLGGTLCSACAQHLLSICSACVQHVLSMCSAGEPAANRPTCCCMRHACCPAQPGPWQQQPPPGPPGTPRRPHHAAALCKEAGGVAACCAGGHGGCIKRLSHQHGHIRGHPAAPERSAGKAGTLVGSRWG